jgi:hypothetical protein
VFSLVHPVTHSRAQEMPLLVVVQAFVIRIQNDPPSSGEYLNAANELYSWWIDSSSVSRDGSTMNFILRASPKHSPKQLPRKRLVPYRKITVSLSVRPLFHVPATSGMQYSMCEVKEGNYDKIPPTESRKSSVMVAHARFFHCFLQLTPQEMIYYALSVT